MVTQHHRLCNWWWFPSSSLTRLVFVLPLPAGLHLFLPDVSDVSDISLFALEHPSKNPPTHFPDSSAFPFGMEWLWWFLFQPNIEMVPHLTSVGSVSIGWRHQKRWILTVKHFGWLTKNNWLAFEDSSSYLLDFQLIWPNWRSNSTELW